MAIKYNEQLKTLTLQTKNSAYQMKIDRFSFLRHLYYGKRVEDDDMEYLHYDYDRPCAGNPDEVFPDRSVSFNTFLQEYTGYGVGDYRVHSIAALNADGSYGVDFRYAGHEIRDGKYEIPGLPASFDKSGSAQTLCVTLRDQVTGLVAELYYGVFEDADVITRHVKIRNDGSKTIRLKRAFSVCLDFPAGMEELIHFHGKHCLERQQERIPLMHGVQTVTSNRGTSSHQHNPFVILCNRDTTEEHGESYGCMLVYSGGFKAEIEKDQFDTTRVVMGIQDDPFLWQLLPGESFHTPEAILSYADNGLGGLSRRFHDFIRAHIIRWKHKDERRPVLINNWEGTYFDFDDEKIFQMAQKASTLGIELFVLDDGWFGSRNSDNAGLGDWYVNTKKLKGGLKPLIDRIHALPMKFGIWIEPEMVNEDSDLYRAHPEWVLAMPDRAPVRCRNQLVLDMGREDVRGYLYDCFSRLLGENPIDYVKWDMNRSICDLYSNVLGTEQQGEVAHRYVLGLYAFMDRLTSEFEDVLFEGCSGGGGRFDAGILHYSPQIWCSDDTDAIERLIIQHGTSYAYPPETWGAHVSAAPNHQTGRTTPIHTRAVVAMSGTFGYELDPMALTAQEEAAIKEQVERYKKFYDLTHHGDYYRLTGIGEGRYVAWEHASRDMSEALVSLVVTNTATNQTLVNLKLKGLQADAGYRIVFDDVYLRQLEAADLPVVDTNRLKDTTRIYSGAALMYAGYTFPWIAGDYPALQLFIQRVGTHGGSDLT